MDVDLSWIDNIPEGDTFWEKIAFFFVRVGASIVRFLTELTSGIEQVSSSLANAPESIDNYAFILPAEFQIAITGFVALLTTLAIVRWIT